MMWYDFLATNALAVLVFCLVLLVIYRTISRPAHLPPGPRPWPIVGNFPSLRGDLLSALRDLRARYGDVYLLYMGNMPTVFVHGEKSIREVLLTRGEEFASRPESFITNEISKGKGIVNTSGEVWKAQRRFTLHTLRDFGFGKSSLEGKVIEEIEVLVQCLKDKAGSAFPIGKLLHISVSNVICSLAFGNRFQHDDPNFVEHMEIMDQNFEAAAFASPLNFLPWLQYLPGDLFYTKRTLQNVDHMTAFILQQIESHKKTFNPDCPQDFIDVYLSEINKTQTDPNSDFKDDQLLKIISDLFVAGTETTATTLQWALLFMINYPEIQVKVRAEIHSVIGRGRFPTMADQKRMPYLQATLLEIQRCADIVPLGVPHAAVQGTTLNGHTIQKGTAVITVLDSLHQDPQAWKNPEVFDPNRFLDSDGGTVIKPTSFLPFSAGKRVCIGETLAKMELFLFLTAMLQKFVFKAPAGMTSLPETRIVGITQRPKPYNLRAIVDD